MTDRIQDLLPELVLGVTFPSMSAPSREKVETIILHDLAIGLVSSSDPPYVAAREIQNRLHPTREGPFTLIGSGRTVSQEEAVFLNAMLMSAKAQEDFCGALHLGPIIISASLAAAQGVGASGQDFLAAVAAGFEAALLLGEILGPHTGLRGFRGTPLYGQAGAALAVGKLLGLGPVELRSALAHALANSFGTAESLLAGTTEWYFQAGWAARKGLWAAHLAALDMRGSAGALSGRAGFLQALCGNEAPANVEIWEEERLLRVGMKRFAVNIFVMSPLEAALRIMDSDCFHRGEEVQKITVLINEKEAASPLVDMTGPFDSTAQGILSIPCCVGLTVLYGDFRRVLVDRANEAPALAMASKVAVLPAVELAPLTTRVTIKTDRASYQAEITDASALYYSDFEGERSLLAKDLKRLGSSESLLQTLSSSVLALEAGENSVEYLARMVGDFKGGRIA